MCRIYENGCYRDITNSKLTYTPLSAGPTCPGLLAMAHDLKQLGKLYVKVV